MGSKYGKNTDKATEMIKNQTPFEDVLNSIAEDCQKWEYDNIADAYAFEKASKTGVPRSKTNIVIKTPFIQMKENIKHIIPDLKKKP